MGFDRFKNRGSSSKFKIRSNMSSVDWLTGDVNVAHLGKDKLNPNLLFTYGLEPGHAVIVIGTSGSGKSTFLTQLVSNMKVEQEKQMKGDQVPYMWFDVEKDSALKQRIANSLHITVEELEERQVYLIKDTNVIEGVFADILQACNDSIDSFYKKDINYVAYGKEIDQVYPIGKSIPAVSIVIDSTTTMISGKTRDSLDGIKENQDMADIAKATDAMITAKALKFSLQNIIQPIFNANVSLFSVAHLGEVKQMGYGFTPPQHPAFAPNEKMIGGAGPVYVSDKIIKLRPSRAKSILKDKYGEFDINQITILQFLKDRSDDGKKIFPMCMKDGQFEEDYSLFIFLSDSTYGKEYLASKAGRYTFNHYKITHPNFYKYNEAFKLGQITEEQLNRFHDQLTIDTSKIPEIADFNQKTIRRAEFQDKVYVNRDDEFYKKWRIWTDAIMKIDIIKNRARANIIKEL